MSTKICEGCSGALVDEHGHPFPVRTYRVSYPAGLAFEACYCDGCERDCAEGLWDDGWTLTPVACYFCDRGWGSCVCTWPDPEAPNAEGFDHHGMWITRPNVSACARFFVIPTTYYGAAFKEWAARRVVAALPGAQS